jgi:dipeptidyl aminopeptidase/acylaminoacyl peptidase
MSNLTLVILLSVLSVNVFASSKKLIPLENFAALPAITQPELSPDGQRILALSTIDGSETVVVAKYGSVEISPVIKLRKDSDRIEWAEWANNERILIYATYPKLQFGKRIRIGRLFAVNSDGSDLKQLQLNKIFRHEQADLFSSISLRNILPDDNNNVLVQTYTGRDESPAVFKFNIYDSSFEKVVSAVHEIGSWVSNSKGEVLIGLKRDYDSKKQELTTDIYFRPNIDTDDWEKIYSYRSFKDFYINPIALSEDKKTLYVMTDFEVYKDVVREFDLEKREFGKIVYQQDKYDVDSAITRDGRFVGVGYTDDFYRIEYFDDELKNRQAMIAQTFPKYKTYITSSSKDKNRLIVAALSANSPTKFFLVDLENKQASFWLSHNASLENQSLPSKLPFSFTTKDNFELYGYFTQGTKGKDSPLIVLPHGGPGSRDTMDFDYWTQMLARQGYAVLQVNFRGSTGYGNNYEISGRKQWGKLMQTDVYETIDWVKSMELADTNNMCMVGASYGGYVALTAGFQKPDAFKCIVSIAGISDLVAMIELDDIYDGLKVDSKVRIGDIENSEEKADLVMNSAINHIGAFKSPVLLIHGENDQIVHYNQSKLMHEALKKNKKKSTLLILEDGTHNVDNPKNRTEAFTAIDKFLAKYLD